MRKLKDFFESGNGEMVAFSIISVFITMIFIYGIAFMQYAYALQAVSKAAIVAARSAAICIDRDEAMKMAEDAALAAANSSSIRELRTDIQMAGATTDWEAGNFINVSVTANVKTLEPYITSGTVRKSHMVVIEASNMTQAADLFALGNRAYEGDRDAQEQIIKILGEIIKRENAGYGVKGSIVLAKIIIESGWVSYHSDAGYKLHSANNVLGMNYGNFTSSDGRVYAYTELMAEDARWYKYQTWIPAHVTQWDESGNVIGTYEAMKSYKSIEDCVNDFICIMVKRHPNLRNNKNINAYASFLQGYTPNGNQVEIVGNIIRNYNLDRYD